MSEEDNFTMLRKLSTKIARPAEPGREEADRSPRGEDVAHMVKDLMAEIENESKAHRMTGKQKKQILLQVMRMVMSELSYFIFRELISELCDLYTDFARGKIIDKPRKI